MVFVRQKVKYLNDCLRTALLYSIEGSTRLDIPPGYLHVLGCSTVTNWMLQEEGRIRVFIDKRRLLDS